jgi:uncharacterized protein (TIGR04141 family)
MPSQPVLSPPRKMRTPLETTRVSAEMAEEAGYLLLDRKLIQIDDVPGPGIEVCDLLDIAGPRYIHVKKSSRQSSVLSHFFKQGGVSAQMLRKYEPFRIKMVVAPLRRSRQRRRPQRCRSCSKSASTQSSLVLLPASGGRRAISRA